MNQADRETSPPAASRRVERIVAAIVLAALAAMLLAWLAFLISHSGVAPAVLFPIGIGAAVGACQTLIFRQLNLRPSALAATILALALGVLAFASEDYCGYRVHVNEYAEAQQKNRLASIVQATTDEWRPLPFADYLAAIIRRNPVWWSIDGVLTVLASAAVAGVAGHSKNAEANAVSHNSA